METRMTCFDSAWFYIIEFPQGVVLLLETFGVQQTASKLKVIYPVVETGWDESFVFVLSRKVLYVFPPAAVLDKDIVREWWIEEWIRLVIIGL